jgi:hypothetical protein
MALTDIQLRNAKSKDKPYKLADGGGLYIEVALSGSKLWRVKYRVMAAPGTKTASKFLFYGIVFCRQFGSVLAKLNPKLLSRNDGPRPLRINARTFCGLSPQDPPRSERLCWLLSYQSCIHSHTLPLMSYRP